MSFPIRVRPGSSRTKVGGGYDGPLGQAIVVCVNSPAVDGRANEAVVRALAQALGVHHRHITIKSGHTSRNKVVLVTGTSTDLDARLRALRGSAT